MGAKYSTQKGNIFIANLPNVLVKDNVGRTKA